jgi:hypothetical protein
VQASNNLEDDIMSRRLTDWLAGAIAGFGATLPMTAFMVFAQRCLPRREQEELPPVKITGQLLRRTGALDLTEPAGAAVTLANHFGYGTAAGTAYAAITGSVEHPSFVRGVAYGLGVSAGSYLGWLPAAGVHRSATNEPLGRNLLMVGAHAIWGASLAAMLPQAQRITDQLISGDTPMPDSDRYTVIRVTHDTSRKRSPPDSQAKKQSAGCERRLARPAAKCKTIWWCLLRPHTAVHGKP